MTLCKIGDKNVVDPSAEEESCSAISLVVGITGNPLFYCHPKDAHNYKGSEGKYTTIGMNGSGSMSPKTLKDAISQAM